MNTDDTLEPGLSEIAAAAARLANVRSEEKASRAASRAAKTAALEMLIEVTRPALPLYLKERSDKRDESYLSWVSASGLWDYHDITFHRHDDDDCECGDDDMVGGDEEGHWTEVSHDGLSSQEILEHCSLREIVGKVARAMVVEARKCDGLIVEHERARARAEAALAALEGRPLSDDARPANESPPSNVDGQSSVDDRTPDVRDVGPSSERVAEAE